MYENAFRIIGVTGKQLQIDEFSPELNIVSSQHIDVDIPLNPEQ